jgi:hydrogenase maturation protease
LSKKVAVVGVGNTLMVDEGVGVVILNLLEKTKFSEKIDFIDAGTSFFNIVSDLKEYDKVVIIDAVYGGRAPGTLYRFEMNEVEDFDVNGMLSLHDLGVTQSIKLEKLTGGFPEDVVFFGIEPKTVELSMELSDEVQDNVEKITDKIIDELMKD